MRRTILVLAVVALPAAALARQAPDPLRETQVTTPEVVRTEYDMREVVAPPPLSDAEVAGWKLFVQRCAVCHDPLGQPSYPATLGPRLNEATVREVGVETVRDVIRVGSVTMPGWQYSLADRQIDQIIAYLRTVAVAPRD